jgi:hypothetical protein
VRSSQWSAATGVIELHHRGVLIATHARRHPPGKEPTSGCVSPRRSDAPRHRRVRRCCAWSTRRGPIRHDRTKEHGAYATLTCFEGSHRSRR